jgi:tetratricopeptide (TPR) repeat protein
MTKKIEKEKIEALLSLYNQRNFHAITQQTHEITSNFSGSFIVWNILGAANQALGNTPAAVLAFKKVIELNANFSEGHNNLGIALMNQGRLNDALRAFENAIYLDPDYTQAHINQAQIYKKQNLLTSSINAYKRAVKSKPDYIEAHFNLGNALFSDGQYDTALKAYTKTVSLKPEFCQAWNNIGIIFHRQENFTKAFEAYSKAITFNTSFIQAWCNGAELLENWNKLEELEAWLKSAEYSGLDVSDELKLFKAKLHWRQNALSDSYRILAGINYSNLSSDRQIDYLRLKAKYFEKNNDFHKSFIFFNEMNLVAKKSPLYKEADAKAYIEDFKSKLAKLSNTRKIKEQPKVGKVHSFSPVFLVGFPRSGTTLLSTILSSHPNINVIDEKPLVLAAERHLRGLTHKDQTKNLSNKKLMQETRLVYEQTLRSYVDTINSQKVLIDKLPLNLLKADVIHKIYPNAKFILALRHPLDAILSSWMQNFKLSPSMSNMLDLKTTVELYNLAMKTFDVCRRKYKLSVHEIKYEKLLNQFDQEITLLLTYLELERPPKINNYLDNLSNDKRVTTPSYSQVIKPLYKDALYRWKNYDEQLRPFLPLVEHWISKYGYDA